MVSLHSLELLPADRVAFTLLALTLALVAACSDFTIRTGDDDDDTEDEPTPQPTPENLDPTALVLDPEPGAVLPSGEAVVLRGRVSDEESAPEELEVVWRSSADGELATDEPGADGISRVQIAPLSVGKHKSMIDADNGVRADQSMAALTKLRP